MQIKISDVNSLETRIRVTLSQASAVSQCAWPCLVLYEEELGGQDRVFGRIQVAGGAFVGHNEESNVADDVELLEVKRHETHMR